MTKIAKSQTNKNISQQIQKILDGDARAIARAITQVENSVGEDVRPLLKELFSQAGHAFVIGVTGSPGTGKSTLVDQLAHYYTDSGMKVGIILVDPSSPFSGGAILGDRIRMQSLSTNPKIFIRSMATRGKLGGLTIAVDEALMILDVGGYEILIVETVGVGQDEVDIMNTADVTLVTLVPGMGDHVQTLKAGIMEIGDIYVVNKSDLKGALEVEGQLTELLHGKIRRKDEWTPIVVKTVATRGKGIPELAESIQRYRIFISKFEHNEGRQKYLFQKRLMDLLHRRVADMVLGRISNDALDEYVEQMMTRELDPHTIVDQLIRDLDLCEEESNG